MESMAARYRYRERTEENDLGIPVPRSRVKNELKTTLKEYRYGSMESSAKSGQTEESD